MIEEADPKKRAEFIEFLKNHEKSELVDESGIDRYLHREHCRVLKGEEVYEAVPGLKFERAALSQANAERTSLRHSDTRK